MIMDGGATGHRGVKDERPQGTQSGNRRGGTGGHLFPGIAVAREFVERHQASVTFLTTPKAVTTQVLERHGLAWEAVSARALKGEGLLSRAAPC